MQRAKTDRFRVRYPGRRDFAVRAAFVASKALSCFFPDELPELIAEEARAPRI